MKNIDLLNCEDESFELDGKQFSKLTKNLLEQLENFVDDLPNLPVTSKDIDSNKFSSDPLPTHPTNLDNLLSSIFDIARHGGHDFHSPGYQCYIPTGGLVEAASFDFLMKTLNRFVGLHEWAPAFAEIEKTAVKWLCEIMGLSLSSSGILTSGGSQANFTAVFTARFNKLSDAEIPNGTAYYSDQIHHSILKALSMVGIPRKNIRAISVDGQCKIKIDELETKIRKDIEEGLKPFLLVGAGGTTASGAIDPLREMSRLAQNHGMWFHVDAAWGGGFRLTKNGPQLFDGIENADSVTFDPHKALFMPMGYGALLVKDWLSLERAHRFDSSYLPSDQDMLEYNPANASLELLRPARGLPLWMLLKFHGIDKFRCYHEEKLALAKYAYQNLKENRHIELYCAPELPVVVFRIKKSALNKKSNQDSTNIKLIEMVNDAHTKISGADFESGFWARLVPFGLRTHKKHVDRTLQRISKAIEDLCSQ